MTCGHLKNSGQYSCRDSNMDDLPAQSVILQITEYKRCYECSCRRFSVPSNSILAQ